MKINETTMLFEDLTDGEANEIFRVVEDIVIRGYLPPRPLPKWLDEWMNKFEFNDHRFLLVISTALPQRALLSVIKHQKKQIHAMNNPV